MVVQTQLFLIQTQLLPRSEDVSTIASAGCSSFSGCSGCIGPGWGDGAAAGPGPIRWRYGRQRHGAWHGGGPGRCIDSGRDGDSDSGLGQDAEHHLEERRDVQRPRPGRRHVFGDRLCDWLCQLYQAGGAGGGGRERERGCHHGAGGADAAGERIHGHGLAERGPGEQRQLDGDHGSGAGRAVGRSGRFAGRADGAGGPFGRAERRADLH